MKIPFNKLYLSGNEAKYVNDAINHFYINGDGYYTKLVSSFLEESFNIKKILMTTSATHALEMAAILIGLSPGDEVIMPSFTFPSTANAVMLHGGRPVFAEIKKNTLNIDPLDIETKITNKTKAIIPVHYAGISCEMDKIMNIATKHNLYVIEDAAQGINSKYKNKFLGSIGHIGCYSFHGTKNYVSGEGGAIAINTEDNQLIERSEIIRQKGTNRNKFLRGEVDKYSWVDIGSSYCPSDILMALLYGQLENLDYIKSKRKSIHEYYSQALKAFIGKGLLKHMTFIPEDCDSNYHLFYLIFDNENIRDKVMYKLKALGINSAIHFLPLHSSVMGNKLGYSPKDLPITENTGKCLLRLPMYTDMTDEEIKYVLENLTSILKEL